MDNISNPVQSADRIFRVMETLCEDGPCSLMDVARKLDLNKTTAFRLLSSLVYMGYAAQDVDTLKYHMTLKLTNLSGKVLSRFDILKTATPLLDELMLNTHEAVHLVRRTGNFISYLYKSEPVDEDTSVRLTSYVGMVSPMYRTGLGKAILGTLPLEETKRIWDESEIIIRTKYTIGTFEGLLEELDKSRSRGYYLDDQENELGVRCIAIPVYDYTGKADYAISVSALLSRMDDERLPVLANMLHKVGAKLEEELGVNKQFI